MNLTALIVQLIGRRRYACYAELGTTLRRIKRWCGDGRFQCLALSGTVLVSALVTAQ